MKIFYIIKIDHKIIGRYKCMVELDTNFWLIIIFITDYNRQITSPFSLYFTVFVSIVPYQIINNNM